MKGKLQSRAWYPLAVSLCIAVVLYVFLTHLPAVGRALATVGGFLSPVLLGLVLAYLMNPLYRLFRRRVFHRVKREALGRALSLILTLLLVAAFLAALLLTVIPQFFLSIRTFVGNLQGYTESLEALLGRLGLSLSSLDFGAILEKVTDYVERNAGAILNSTLAAGKSIGGFGIAFLLSIYLLAEKESLKSGMTRLLRLLLPERSLEGLFTFLARADTVLLRYIIFSLLESLIVGALNAAFMLLTGMSYAPLVSFVVAVTNLIPTFGPIIGAAIGAFVLLLAKPVHALWFLGFTVVLQLLDGYVLKPRLFGNSLGVSGLWILIAIVVGGKMFGVVGMLLAIPSAAIAVDLYLNYLIPWLERRRERRERPRPAE